MSNEKINKLKNNNYDIKKVNKEEYSSSSYYSINNQNGSDIKDNTNSEVENYDVSSSNNKILYSENNNTDINNYTNGNMITPLSILANYDNYANPSTIDNIDDWWKKILNKFGIESPETKALEQLKKNGIYINDINKIKSVSKSSDGSYYVYLRNDCAIHITTNGKVDYILTPDAIYSFDENGNIKYISIKSGDLTDCSIYYDKNGNIEKIITSDGQTITFNLSPEEQDEIRKATGIKDDIEIKGYAEITVNGFTTKVYLVGDTSLESYLGNLNSIKEALNTYPPNVLEYIKNNSDFKGFFIGTADCINTDMPDYNNGYGYTAFASGTKYIYINSDSNKIRSKETIIHELGHVLDKTIGGNNYNSNKDYKFKELYEKYKKIIQEIILNGYTSNYYPEGVPTPAEFFACAIPIYLEKPEELKELIPEVYEFIDELFKKL